jgi:hypothetical protein
MNPKDLGHVPDLSFGSFQKGVRENRIGRDLPFIWCKCRQEACRTGRGWKNVCDLT